MSAFTWIPFYTELAAKLLAYRDRQDELIAILKGLKDQGRPVTPLADKDRNGRAVRLTVMDPFTFFGSFNRKATEQNRKAILSAVKQSVSLTAEVPSDFVGIPVLNPQRSQFFPYQSARKPDDIAALWAFAEAITERTPDEIDPALFNRCIEIQSVSVTNLTMGMFWMRPDTYLALDSRNRKLLDARGVAHDVRDWASYIRFLKETRSNVSEKPYEFSRAAFTGAPDCKYWIFQGNPQYYDVLGALRNGALKTWEVNQHKKDIHPGDRVIIWVTGQAAGCYALATVMSEVHTVTEDANEAVYRKQPVKNSTMEGVTLRIDTNLWNTPVSKEDIAGQPAFRDFPAGRQGTNLAAIKAHYDGILAFARGRTAVHYWKVSHGKKDFSAEERKTCLEQHVIVVHKDTAKGQGAQFAKEMKEGDLFYLCHGNDDGIRVFGRVTGPAVAIPDSEGWLQRKYDVVFDGVNPTAKYMGVKKGWAPNYNSTCMAIPDQEINLFESEILIPFFGKRLTDIPEPGQGGRKLAALPSRNIILYGPPGTGKTWTLRNEYMKHFTERAAALSKEDFAADLVADLAWWQVITMVMLDLKTSTVSGILAHPLMQARIRRANNRTPRAAVWAHLQMHTKIDCQDVKYSKRYEPLLFSKDAKSVWSIDGKLATEEAADLVEVLERYRGYTPGQGAVIKRFEFTTFHQAYSYEDFVEGIKPVMSEEVAEALAYEVKPGIFKTMVQRALVDPSHDYALLIDEISRGNVASIFGELITLIEDDKRKGAKNELCARLPYSREEFVVPSNLYIIGAMNTADRSVEALDTALRRRFTFVAIPPQPERIQQPANLNVDLRKLLGVINARIEKLLDKDHCIGHSYFMGIAESGDPLAELRNVFATKILPLMEEYFYGDPAKIGMVLGERFVSRKDDATEWAEGDWGMDEFEERHVYTLRDPMTMKDEDFRAVYE
jgi:hypothetical protein